jgi:hypothetical protein
VFALFTATAADRLHLSFSFVEPIHRREDIDQIADLTVEILEEAARAR